MSKNLKFNHVLALCGCALFSLGILPHAAKAAGGDVSGGGDIYAQEFNMIGRSLVRNYQQLGIPAGSGVTPEILGEAVENTVIATVDETKLGDRIVDAINYPGRHLIQLNRSRWESMPDNREQKITIALHEYLRIAGANDDNYQISSVVLENLRPLLVEAVIPQHFLCNVTVFKESYGIIGRIESNPYTGWIPVGTFDSAQSYGSGEVSLNIRGNPWGGGDLANYSVLFRVESDYLRPAVPPTLNYQIVKDNSETATVVQDWKAVDFSIRGAYFVVVPLVNFGIERSPKTPYSIMRCYKY